MAGAGDIVAVCLFTTALVGALWLIHHPGWHAKDRTVSVREPHSHVHVLRKWDET